MKNINKIIGVILSLSVLPLNLSVMAEDEQGEMKCVDLSSYLDADMIVNPGDDLGESWLGGETVTNSNFAGISGSALPADGYIKCYKRIPTEEQLGNSSKTNWSSVTKSKTEYITAYINPKNYSGGVNDAVHIPGDKTPVTINLSGGMNDKIHVFMQGSASYNKLAYSINYKDGTSETVSGITSTAYQYTLYNPIANIPGLSAFSDTYIRINANENTKKAEEGNSIGMMYALEIDADGSKEAESIAFSVNVTDSDEHGYFIYSMIEEPIKESTMLEAVEKALGITNVETDEDRKQIQIAIRYAEILEEKGHDMSDKITKLNNLIKKAEAEMAKHIDLAEYLNSDLIGMMGETVGESWLGGLLATDNFAGIVGDNLPSDGYINSYIYTPGTDTTQNWNTATKSLTEYVTAYINPDRYEAGVDDTVYIPGDRSDVKINLNGEISEKIYVFMQGSHSYNRMEYTLTYSDGTTKTESNTNSAAAQNILYNSISDTPRLISFSENYKRAEVLDSKITEGSTVRMMYVLSLDVDSTKKAESLTLKVYNENNGQGYFVYAITALPTKSNEIINLLKSAYENLDAANLSNSNPEDMKKVIMYASELEKRGIDISEYVDKSKVSELSEIVFNVSTDYYRQDAETVIFEIDFGVEIDKENLSDNISVLKNGEAFKNYNLETDEKGAKIIIKESKEGGNTFDVKVSGRVRNNNYPDITLKEDRIFSMNTKPYISGSVKGTAYVLTNNSKVDENYILSVASDELKVFEGAIKAGESINIKDAVVRTLKKVSIWNENMSVLYDFGNIKNVTDKTDFSADYSTASLDMADNTVMIKGITPSGEKEKIVTAMIYLPDGETLFSDEIKTNEDGYFSFKTSVSEDQIDSAGFLKIYIGGDDFEEKFAVKDLWIAKKSERESYIEQLKSAENSEKTTEILNASKNTLGLDFAPFNAIDTEKLAERIFEIREKLDENNIQISQKLIKQQAILEAFEDEENISLLFKDKLFLYDGIMNYSEIDKDGATLYEIYNSSITPNGMENIKKSLLGKEFDNVDALKNELAKLIMLNSMKYPSESGVGYVGKVLTKENAKMVGIEISKYFSISNKTKIDKEISEMNITSLEDVVDKIKNWNEKPTAKYPSGSGSGGSGGGMSIPVVNTAPKEDLKTENTEEDAEMWGFTDIDESHWAYSYVQNLYDKGIMNGKGNNLFAPEESITRAEFVKILCMMSGIEESTNSSKFSDVADDEWYTGYVMAAYEKGIINGIKEDYFGANEAVKRQDICTMLYRIAESEAVSDTLEFADISEISDYAYEAVIFFAEKGVVNGFTDKTFRPKGICTRAQAAAIICKYLGIKNN